MMETITKKSATQLALENLRSYIMDNSVRVGDRFPTEKDLCGTLGVGRGTVREAVKVLISQGFLEIRPGLGTFIRSKTPIQTDSLSNWFLNNEVELQDLMVVRSTLELLATKLAIERCGDEQLAALKKNQWQDQLINIIIILLISMPSIVMGLIIQYFLCFRAGWFPTTMNSGYEYFTWSMFRSMMPPVLSLCLGSVAGYARFTRAELSEVLTNEFMLLARTKGLTRGQATLRHAMRNSMVVIFPSILSEFIGVLSGSLIIESMFSVPGVGRLYLDSINSLDYDFFMMLSGFYCLVALLGGIVIDISYGFIDPRIRMGAK